MKKALERLKLWKWLSLKTIYEEKSAFHAKRVLKGREEICDLNHITKMQGTPLRDACPRVDVQKMVKDMNG